MQGKNEHVRAGYQGYNMTKIVAIKCRKVLNCPNEEEVRRSIIKGRSCDCWAIAYRQHHTTKFAVRQEHSSKSSNGVCCLNSKILILLLLLLLYCVCVCDVYMGMHVSQSACGGQIATLWHPFSPSTFTWDPRSEFRSTDLNWAISPAQLGSFLPCYEIIIRSPVCEALAYNSFCQYQNVLNLEFPVNVLMKLSCLQIWKETVTEQAEGS